jgi:hypothetical protein
MVGVAEVHAITHRGVAGAKKLDHRRGRWIRQVVAHEFDEDHRASVVVVSDFQSESIRFVLEMTADRQQWREEYE